MTENDILMMLGGGFTSSLLIVAHLLYGAGPTREPRRIRVSSDFARFPAGKLVSDGPNSGQKLREVLLIPAMAEGPVELNLDVLISSAFLEGSFRGLAHVPGLDMENLSIRSGDPSIVQEIWDYIMATPI